MEPNFLHLPMKLNWDASIIKTSRLLSECVSSCAPSSSTCSTGPTLPLPAANAQFVQANINATTFGRLLGTSPAGSPARVVQFAGRLEF
jgi:hypothetical protein